MTDVDDWTQDIHQGDALDVLDDMPAESVHAVVTDPPYGLAFMGRDWDDFEPKEYQDWCEQWASKAKRVLKPGGHLLAFSGNRTHHRAFTGVEDAGFEIRDTVTWHYGNGFPKNTDTLLKPATEFLVLARKPFDGSAADCFEEHGTAHLNVDECRIDGERPEFVEGDGDAVNDYGDGLSGSERTGGTVEGRYPANLVLGENAASQLDSQTGTLESGETDFSKHDDQGVQVNTYGDYPNSDDRDGAYGGDSGGASRFYYCSKATKAERTLNGQIDNGHPTVKPLDLMEWLVRLISREGQIVLDPFCGTGTTCKAAKDLGREWIGIEQNKKWVDVARVRAGLQPEEPKHVRPGDQDQFGLEEFGGGQA